MATRKVTRAASKKLKLNQFHVGNWKLGTFTAITKPKHAEDFYSAKALFSTLSFTESMDLFKHMAITEPYDYESPKERNELEMRRVCAVSHKGAAPAKRDEFCGGTMQELFKDKSTVDFLQYQRKVRNDLVKKSSYAKALKRKRCFSEHDGNFDYSRRWDLACYESSKKEFTQSPFIEINIHVSFSCAMESDVITKYGGLCTAIISHLEALGYLTTVNLISTSQGSFSSEKAEMHIKKIRMKNTTDYCSVQKMLTAFSGNYLRRVLFTHIILGADACGVQVASSYGHPYRYTGDYNITDKSIDIFSTSVASASKQDQFISDIIKGLKIG